MAAPMACVIGHPKFTGPAEAYLQFFHNITSQVVEDPASMRLHVYYADQIATIDVSSNESMESGIDSLVLK